MNDEQQFWRDIQKFMNQFPGFVAMAKSIGQIGDIKAQQDTEQRKLDALTQEVEKQRKVIATERDAANVEAARKAQEIESQAQQHASLMHNIKSSADADSAHIIDEAHDAAAKIVATAQVKAKEITDVLEPKKTALEAEIAALIDKVTAAKNDHAAVTGALEKAKSDHASFLKKLLGDA